MLKQRQQQTPSSMTESRTALQNRQSLQMLSTIGSSDQSMMKYCNSLIPDSAVIEQGQQPEISVHRLRVYHKGDLISCQEISKDMKIKLPEQQLYHIQIEFTVKKGIVFGLTVVNSVSKGFIRLKKEQYRQGSYPPTAWPQTAQFSVRAPGGLLGRGGYTGEAAMQDKFGKVYLTLRYNIEII